MHGVHDLGCFYGIVVRIDTVLSFMYGMYVRRMGPFDHDYGLRLSELGCGPYRHCFELYVRCAFDEWVYLEKMYIPVHWMVRWMLYRKWRMIWKG